jgi:hypothetical protein
MNQERMMMKGQLAEKKHRYGDLDVEAKGIISLIRLNLNPFEEDVTRLSVSEAAVLMGKLQEIQKEMLGLKQVIEKMEDALG